MQSKNHTDGASLCLDSIEASLCLDSIEAWARSKRRCAWTPFGSQPGCESNCECHSSLKPKREESAKFHTNETSSYRSSARCNNYDLARLWNR